MISDCVSLVLLHFPKRFQILLVPVVKFVELACRSLDD